jgi:hypothetical protein
MKKSVTVVENFREVLYVWGSGKDGRLGNVYSIFYITVQR